MPGVVDDDVVSLSRCEELAVGGPPDLVTEGDGAAAQFEQSGADQNLVIVPGGLAVGGPHLGHREERVVVNLHVAVVESIITTELDPADLEPDEVVGMVDDAGLIGLGIADAGGDFGPFYGRGSGIH